MCSVTRASRVRKKGRIAVRLRSIVLTVLSLTFLAPAALAAPSAQGSGEHRADGAKFPMKAADFQKKVDDRIKKARERMEAHLAKKNPSDDKKKEVRAKFDAGVAEVRKVVTEVSADGVVTKEEAQKVKQTARQMRGHHKGGARAKK